MQQVSLIAADVPQDIMPFQNPICKQTYQSLPRIYGKKNKNKNKQLKVQAKFDKYQHNNSHKYSLTPDSLRGISRYLFAKPHNQRLSDVLLARNGRLLTQGDNNTSSLKKQEKYTSYSQNSKKKISLKPIMTEVKSFQLSDIQISSQRQIYNDSKIALSQLENSAIKKRLKQTTHHNQSDQQTLKTQKRMKKISFNLKIPQNQHIKKANENIEKKYNIQRNFEICNQLDQQNEQDISEPIYRRKATLMKNSHSETYSQNEQNSKQQNISSSRLSVNGSNQMTMFISLEKQRYSKLNSCRDSRAQDKLSNGLFRIPEEDQYRTYIDNYQPLGTNFSLKSILKRQAFKIIRDPKSIYFGQVNLNDQRHGLGVTVSQKQIFEGEYKNNIKFLGCEKNIDGVFIGAYKNGLRFGQGQFRWNNGQIFKGNWINGMKNGFGKWKAPQGHYYEGEWLHNRQHGNGIFKHNLSTYRGQFQNFLKHGKGQQVFKNGDKYKGEYKQGKPEGKGRYQWSSGGYYEGDFKKGRRDGDGVWIDSQGIRYEGQFKQDYKNGLGIQTYQSGERFQGTFKNGQRQSGKYFNARNQQISGLLK